MAAKIAPLGAGFHLGVSSEDALRRTGRSDGRRDGVTPSLSRARYFGGDGSLPLAPASLEASSQELSFVRQSHFAFEDDTYCRSG